MAINMGILPLWSRRLSVLKSNFLGKDKLLTSCKQLELWNALIRAGSFHYTHHRGPDAGLSHKGSHVVAISECLEEHLEKHKWCFGSFVLFQQERAASSFCFATFNDKLPNTLLWMGRKNPPFDINNHKISIQRVALHCKKTHSS